MLDLLSSIPQRSSIEIQYLHCWSCLLLFENWNTHHFPLFLDTLEEFQKTHYFCFFPSVHSMEDQCRQLDAAQQTLSAFENDILRVAEGDWPFPCNLQMITRAHLNIFHWKGLNRTGSFSLASHFGAVQNSKNKRTFAHWGF